MEGAVVGISCADCEHQHQWQQHQSQADVRGQGETHIQIVSQGKCCVKIEINLIVNILLSFQDDENKKGDNTDSNTPTNGSPLKCDIVRGCLWIKGDTFLRIPEVEEFENDMFGGDLIEKVTRMERIYATNGKYIITN